MLRSSCFGLPPGGDGDHAQPGATGHSLPSVMTETTELAPVELHSCRVAHRPALRFRFHDCEKCLRHAIVHRPLLRNAMLTALVVGTALTLINQGNVLLGGNFPTMVYWKLPLTYSVPYLVSTWAALRISAIGRRRVRAE